MSTSKIYKLVSCPKYLNFEDAMQRIDDNLKSQSAFWNAIRMLQNQNEITTAELKFISTKDSNTIEIYLVLIQKNGHLNNERLEILERLLPEEYGWQVVTDDAIYQLISHMPIKNWRVARLIRNLEFIDITSSFLWFFGQTQGNRLNKSKLTKEDLDHTASDTPLTPDNVLSVIHTKDKHSGKKRRLPIPALSPQKQMETTHLCIPFLGNVPEEMMNRNRLYYEMQHAAPIIISISIHPIEIAALDDDRIVSAHLQQYSSLINATSEDYRYFQKQSEGLERIREIWTTYERYLMPNNNLCNLTIRVAAANDADALKVSHCMSACMGGLRIFDILSPSRDILSKDLNFMAESGVDIPTFEQFDHEQYQKFWTSILKKRLGRVGIEYQKMFEGFLLRMPHLFSMDEADRLIQLPISREEGIPGIVTKVVSPFYATHQKSHEFHKKPDLNEIRLGLIRCAMNFQNNTSKAPLTQRQISSKNFQSSQWHTIPINDLCKHSLIVGSTGSGKTVTTMFMLREVNRTHVPFLVIEPVKTEYYTNLKKHIPDVQRFSFESTSESLISPDYLVFDPMRLQNGVTVSRHISYLKSCFNAAFPMTDVFSLFLENGLFSYYTRPVEKGGCGLTFFQRGGVNCHHIDKKTGMIYPSFEHFSNFFLTTYLHEEMTPENMGKVPSGAFELFYTWKLAFRRRFINLLNSSLGISFRRSDELVRQKGIEYYNQFPLLLKHPTVLELDAISDNEQKSLIMAFLLTFLFEHRQIENSLSQDHGTTSHSLSHLLVLEEAHRLLSRSSIQDHSRGSDIVGQSSSAKAISLFIDMLAEIRAYGQGVTIVEQIPTKIIPDAVKNTNLKIMLRVTAEEDRNYLGESMNFNETQKRYVMNLKPGEYIVFEENLDQPVFLEIPMSNLWNSLNIF